MKNTLNLILFASLCFLCATSCNEKLSNEEVESISTIRPETNVVAMDELSNVIADYKCLPKGAILYSRGNDVETFYDEFGNPALYVVNFDEGGYIVVSAQKSYYPILACSEKGNFSNAIQIIPTLSEWKDNIIKKVSASMSLPKDSIDNAIAAWKPYEEPNKLNLKSSRDFKPGTLDQETWMSLQVIFQDSLQSWNAKGYSVSTLNDYIRKEHENYWNGIFDDLDNYARNSVWPEYEVAYQDLTFVVEKFDAHHYGSGNMIKTEWNQENGYEESMPPVGSRRYAKVGCLSVAAGQIMYKYRHPECFNWDDMKLNVPSQSICDFLFYLTSNTNPTYLENETKTDLVSMTQLLNQTLGYNATLVKKYDANAVYAELKNGRPVIVSSTLNGEKNHSWIASGWSYSTSEHIVEIWSFPDIRRFQIIRQEYHQGQTPVGYFINWGNGGMSDGSYLDLLHPIPNYTDFTSNNPYCYLTMYPK